MHDLHTLERHRGLLELDVERRVLAHQQLDVALLGLIAQQTETDVVGAGWQPDDGVVAFRRCDRVALLPGLTVRHRDLRGDERRARRSADAPLEVDRILGAQAGGRDEPCGGQQDGAESVSKCRHHRTTLL